MSFQRWWIHLSLLYCCRGEGTGVGEDVSLHCDDSGVPIGDGGLSGSQVAFFFFQIILILVEVFCFSSPVLFLSDDRAGLLSNSSVFLRFLFSQFLVHLSFPNDSSSSPSSHLIYSNLPSVEFQSPDFDPYCLR